MDLEHSAERETLYDQRVICGWNKDKVNSWKESMARGERTMFWITIPGSDKTAGLNPIKGGHDEIYPVGHVSLDRVDLPEGWVSPDHSVATGDGSVITLTCLFVLPQFGGMKLGAFAMDECERLAQEEPYGSPKCQAITVTTLSPRYLTGGTPGPEGMGRWALLGDKMPERNNAIWYTRRGYVRYKEGERYSHRSEDGSIMKWYAVFMRKELGGPGPLK